MATKTAIKAPRKKKVRLAPTIKRGNKITGPNFEGWETWSGEQYQRFQRNARD